MSGLYIHIPYCRQKCIYCDFYSSPTRENKTEYLKALIKEYNERKEELKTPIQTIYIGGGTPSSLSPRELDFLFENILMDRKYFGYKDNISELEISFEANPENLNEDYLKYLKTHTPINRLSIGIQSFCNEDLRLLGRRHNSLESKDIFLKSRDMGFDNVSIDLMFNLPYTNAKKWENNLKQAVELNPNHISAYSLMVEENTILHTLIKKGKIQPLREEEELEQFNLTIDYLTASGFEHYETSNYSKPSYQSKHNSSYWSGIEYLGLGASAHSFNGNERRWNISNIKDYIKCLNDCEKYFDKEILSLRDKYNEYILVGVRVREGFNPKYIKEIFPHSYYMGFKSTIIELINDGLILRDDKTNNYVLSRKGIFLSNQIALKLFI